MHNFRRVIFMALRERATIGAAIFCSVMVAVLWGANLGLVKPLIEVVFSGRTPHQWVDWQIERSRGEVEHLRTSIAAAESQLAVSDDSVLRSEQGRMQFELGAEEKSLVWLQQLSPYIKRYCP